MCRTRKAGRVIEGLWRRDLAPVDADDFFPPWEYQPVAPYRIQVWPDVRRPHAAYRVSRDLSYLLEKLADVPVERGWTAIVLDETFKVVVGWTGDHAIWEQWPAPVWYGCRAGFDALRALDVYDEMRLLGWELMARGGGGDRTR